MGRRAAEAWRPGFPESREEKDDLSFVETFAGANEVLGFENECDNDEDDAGDSEKNSERQPDDGERKEKSEDQARAADPDQDLEFLFAGCRFGLFCHSKWERRRSVRFHDEAGRFNAFDF